LENNTSHWQVNLISRNTNIKKSYPPFTKRILIVDDHPNILLTFKRGLEAEKEYSSGDFLPSLRL
jgi:hypothetical protein